MLPDEEITRVDNVSKCDHLWSSPLARMTPLLEWLAGWPLPPKRRQDIRRRVKRLYRKLFAPHGVSRTVRRGESPGIIGRHGPDFCNHSQSRNDREVFGFNLFGTQADHIIHHWMHDALAFRSTASPTRAVGPVGLPMLEISPARQKTSAPVGRIAPLSNDQHAHV